MRAARSFALVGAVACSDGDVGGGGGSAAVGFPSTAASGTGATPTTSTSTSTSRAATTGGTGGGTSGGVRLTGSGFGENPTFAPLRFLDFCQASGASWIEAGGDSIVEEANTFAHGTATAEVTQLDGLPTGCGSWEKHVYGDLADDGRNTDGPFHHEQIDIAPTRALTVFKHVKIEHLAGLSTIDLGAQYKGTRVGVASEDLYHSTPRLGASLWTSDGATGFLSPHWWQQGGDEMNVGGDALDVFDGAWHSTFMQAQLSSAPGASDGRYREWWVGRFHADTSTLALIDDPTLAWRGVQINPGLANGYGSSGEWVVRHARVVVIEGLGWVAYGNAATFSACTDLLVVEPRSWSDDEIRFDTRGTIPDEYAWIYVMRADGALASEVGFSSFASDP